MGIAKPPLLCSSSTKTLVFSHANKTHPYPNNPGLKPDPYPNSMSHNPDYHPHHQENNTLFAFSNGFDRSLGLAQQAQIRRENDTNNIKVRGFEPIPPSTLVEAEDPSTASLHPVYETAGMLSEMFNYGPGPAAGTAPPPEILDYRRAVSGLGSTTWYGSGKQVPRDNSIGDQHLHHQQGDNNQNQHHHHHHHQMGGINAESAEAMQLFLTNPQPKSPSPPPQPQPQPPSSSTLHMLLPTPSNLQPGGFLHPSTSPNPNFWGTHINNPAELGGIVEAQGLSLSLSSSLQHLEAAKQAEELRNMGSGDGHIMFFNHPNSSTLIQGTLQGVGSTFGSGPSSITGQHMGFGSGNPTSTSLGMVNALRNSKYAKPAQELLEEFCSVGRGHLKKSAKLTRQNSTTQNATSSGGTGGGGGSTAKDPPQLSAADRVEHQRRKVKLLSMLDEVDRRYNHYCEQMQMVVNSFDLVMGYGAAIPYTALAQKAMSRHFRCLKDAVQAQVRQSCEALGEKDPTASSGLTKGETPRLKQLEQSLRQQRAFHQMGMMEQEAWRPQRGLPERSVNILRAWLFEHFLHPYPSDADKHMLSRQTGLSRNQVSNWFINARVRLWKPMVEEMYQQEAKDGDEEEEEEEEEDDTEEKSELRNQTSSSTSSFAPPQPQTPIPSSSSAPPENPKTSSDSLPPHDHPHPSLLLPHHHQPPPFSSHPSAISQAFLHGAPANSSHFGFAAAGAPDDVDPTTMIRFGTAAGDVSLTLGLRHAGNVPDKNAAFSVRDFGGS